MKIKRAGLHMDKAAGAVAVTTAGGCGFVNGCTVNEMLFAVICILASCLVWQIAVVVWQCRLRRKRTEELLRRRCDDGKPR